MTSAFTKAPADKVFISCRQKDNKGGRQGAPFPGATQSRFAGRSGMGE